MSQAPYGYKWAYDENHNKELVEDHYEQNVLKMIQGLRDRKGLSFPKIAQHLVQFQIKNKSGRVRWTRSMVYYKYIKVRG